MEYMLNNLPRQPSLKLSHDAQKNSGRPTLSNALLVEVTLPD